MAKRARDRRRPPPKARRLALVVVALAEPSHVGQAVATRVLLRALRETGIEHELVALPAPFMPGGVWARTARRGLAAALLPWRVARARRRLSEDQPLVYLQAAHGPAGMTRDLVLLAVAAWRHWPMVLHVHGGGYGAGLAALPSPLRSWLRTLVARSRRVIVLTPGLRAPFSDWFPGERLEVLGNGVEREVSEAAGRRRKRRRARRGLDVLFLGHLTEEKGFPTVLAAARLCAERRLAHRFEVAGPEPASARSTLGQDPTNVTRLGALDAQARLEALGRADVVVLPSRAEGQPLAILEAMSFGLPVIVTPVGGVAETVEDGVHGLWIPPDDPAALVEALERLAGDSKARRAMGALNQRHASQAFLESTHTTRLIEILESAAGGGASPGGSAKRERLS